MAQSREIAFAGEGGSLRMALHFPPDSAVGRWDCIRTSITAEAERFTGTFTACVFPGDLERLRNCFTELHERVGQTETTSVPFLEAPLEMQFRPDRIGHLTIEVKMAADEDRGSFLSFSMEADQSYLPRWIAAIERALPPVVESEDSS